MRLEFALERVAIGRRVSLTTVGSEAPNWATSAASPPMRSAPRRSTLCGEAGCATSTPHAVERGVAVVAAGVYNSGLLSRQEIAPHAQFEYAAAPADVLALAHTVAGLCALHGVELPEAAIQFPLRHPAVASVVIGARDGDQVEQSLARASRPIPSQLWSDIDAVVMGN